MEAVIETISDFEGSEEKARRSLPNFSREAMERMIASDFEDPTRRIVVATSGDEVVGQALYSLKIDEGGRRYGYCFSRYVLPSYRRRGIASLLLDDALTWFAKNGACYARAETHIANAGIQNLFRKKGFSLSGPYEGPWSYYILRKELS